MSQFFTNSVVPALAETVPAGRVVTLTGSLAGLANNAAESPLGVSNSDGVTGDLIELIYIGSALMDASGSISQGDTVTCGDDNDGKVGAITTLAASLQGWTVGVAQTDAVGGKVRVFVNPSPILIRS